MPASVFLGFPVLGKHNALPSHSPVGAQEPVESLSHPERLSGRVRATQCPGVQCGYWDSPCVLGQELAWARKGRALSH